MAGTSTAAKKVAAKNIEKDPDYYRKMGGKGGRGSRGYAFAHGKLDPKLTGIKGGRPKKQVEAV